MSAAASPMKAIEIASYGAPEVLRLVDRPAPVAGAGLPSVYGATS